MTPSTDALVETLGLARDLVKQGRGYGTWENRLAEAVLAFHGRAETAEARVRELEGAATKADDLLRMYATGKAIEARHILINALATTNKTPADRWPTLPKEC